MEQHEARGDVGAVGVADGDELSMVEAVLFEALTKSASSWVRKTRSFVVEDALREAAEKRGRRARRPCRGGEDGGTGRELLSERDQVLLVPAGAV
jgi:hypothetical protein